MRAAWREPLGGLVTREAVCQLLPDVFLIPGALRIEYTCSCIRMGTLRFRANMNYDISTKVGDRYE